MDHLLRSCTLLTFACLTSLAGAAAITLDGVESTYTPGTTSSFEVVLPSLTDLGSYNIDLVLTGTTGVAGTDFFFDVAATEPANPNYVFRSTANFFDAVNVDAASEHRLTLSDFDLSGLPVVPGNNDRVAIVVFGTVADYQGDLTIGFDFSGLILDTPDTSPTPVGEFDQVLADTTAGGSFEIVPIPEPSGALLASAVLAMLLVGGVRKTCARSN